MTTGQQSPGYRAGGQVMETPGPYSGRVARALGYLPRFIRGFVVEAGGMALLMVQILWSAVRHPVGYWGAVFEDMHRTIKQAWLPVAAGIFGFLIFISILGVQFLNMVGAAQLYGPLSFLFTIRSYVIWINSVVVAGVIGAALTADLGARKVREELEAMEVMGVDPVRELALPRVLSLTLTMTFLSIPAVFTVLFSMQLGAEFVAHLPAQDFYSNVFDNVSYIDIAAVVLNSFLVGLLIGAVCSYKGLNAAGGAIGLGRAVNQAVVVCFVSVFVMQLGYQSVVLGLLPGLGDFK